MSTNELEAEVDLSFLRSVHALDACSPRAHELPITHGSSLTGARALELFDSMLGSRHLDLTARWLRQKRGAGFYTIGSSGHEGNAAVAAALRPTDPALLHYRSGAFFLERARQVPGTDALYDVLLGICAATEEPIAGGRHKVFGSHALAVIPQTSTIASQLPRSLGVAFAIERTKKLGVTGAWPRDAITITSFGDASANHSTATGAINAACHSAHAGHPLPLLFVCEDNGIGISVATPSGWIRAAYGQRPGLKFFEADGGDLIEAVAASEEAASWVRSNRRPAFLHLRVVRLMGHAGSDAEATYRTPDQISAEIARDPLVRVATLLIRCGVLTPDEALARYEAKRAEVVALAEKARTKAQLTTLTEVVAPLSPRSPARVAELASHTPPREVRARFHDGKLPEEEGPLTLCLAINRTLADLFASHPELIVFGEDVGKKGGVYGVTKGLQRRVGPARVFDTLLDEQTILGLALGTAVSGLLPIPEIQYLAYLHNAEDQLRGEAASLSFFSNGQYRNGMVVRVAGYGYQKGFGGHFHNDDAVAVLRDIPGIVVASPSRPDDAAAMLRTCVAAAKTDGTVCVFLEPIALYHTRDLHEPGDGGWLAPYPDAIASAQQAGHSDRDHHVAIGRARTYLDGQDLTMITSGNGLFMSLRVAARLGKLGIDARVVDLRWIAPLPEDDIVREARATGRVLVVDETRKSGGIGEGVVAALVDRGFEGKIRRVASADSFIPLGDAALTVLLDEATIEAAARELVRR